MSFNGTLLNPIVYLYSVVRIRTRIWILPLNYLFNEKIAYIPSNENAAISELSLLKLFNYVDKNTTKFLKEIFEALDPLSKFSDHHHCL